LLFFQPDASASKEKASSAKSKASTTKGKASSTKGKEVSTKGESDDDEDDFPVRLPTLPFCLI